MKFTIPRKFQLKTLICILLIFLTSLSEAFGLSLIFPLIETLFNSRTSESAYLNFFKDNLNYNVANEFIVILLLILIAFIFKFIVIMIRNVIMYSLELEMRSHWIQGVSIFYSSNIQNENQKTSGKTISEMSNEPLKAASAFRQILEFISQVTLILSLITVIFLTNMLITTIILTIFILMSSIQIFIIRRGKTLGDARFETENNLYEIISDTVAGMFTSKIMNKEIFLNQRLLKKLEIFINNMRKIEIITRIPQPLTELITVTLFVSLLFVIDQFTNFSIETNLPTIGLFSIVLFRIATYSGSLFNNFIAINTLLPSFYNTSQIAEKGHSIILKNRKNYIGSNLSLLIKNLYFSYSSDKIIFINKNYNIEKSTLTFVTGKSGVGKSTFFKLLVGILKPDQGSISFYNQSNKNIDIKSYNLIGYVEQDPFFFNDDIITNITFERNTDNIDFSHLNECLKISCCTEFIAKLHDGIKNNIGERGNRLSGGQKARVALARALYDKPKILILDEIFSSINVEISTQILNSLNDLKKEMTIVIITHQKNYLSFADNVLNLDEK